MMNASTMISALLLSVLLSGCFQTQIQSGQPRSTAPMSEDRQWFTLGGLVQLSDAAGHECAEGVSYVESGYSGTDVLIGVGMAVVGSIVAVSVCDLPADPTDEEVSTYSLCTSGIAGAVPFLLGSRTVEYQCVGGVGAPGVQAPRLSLIPGMPLASQAQDPEQNPGQSSSVHRDTHIE